MQIPTFYKYKAEPNYENEGDIVLKKFLALKNKLYVGYDFPWHFCNAQQTKVEKLTQQCFMKFSNSQTFSW